MYKKFQKVAVTESSRLVNYGMLLWWHQILDNALMLSENPQNNFKCRARSVSISREESSDRLSSTTFMARISWILLISLLLSFETITAGLTGLENQVWKYKSKCKITSIINRLVTKEALKMVLRMSWRRLRKSWGEAGIWWINCWAAARSLTVLEGVELENILMVKIQFQVLSVLNQLT